MELLFTVLKFYVSSRDLDLTSRVNSIAAFFFKVYCKYTAVTWWTAMISRRQRFSCAVGAAYLLSVSITKVLCGVIVEHHGAIRHYTKKSQFGGWAGNACQITGPLTLSAA